MRFLNKSKLIAAILSVCLLLTVLAACGEPAEQPKDPAKDQPQVIDPVDYAASIAFNKNSNTRKTEVTVKTYVDGDTTHFYVPENVMETGVFKARYLAVNTPESTGKIEEYGKKASRFTKEKLSAAESIYIESDTANWDADSTGDRYLVWVWYKTSEMEDYRNLNIELLQEGLAIASSSANNRYGSVCTSAIDQAKAMKLNVYSGQKDPDFYYGDAVELTLKELRSNIDEYNGIKVAFEGVITLNNNNGVYVESYDPENDLYYGLYVYYGFSLSGTGLEILKVGNKARIVGTVQYYEAGGTYQVSGLSYRQMKPNDPSNIQMISSGHEPAYVLTDADKFVNGKVDVEVGEEIKTFDYAALAINSSIAMNDLTVVDVYTTKNEDSSSFGAMTFTCKSGDLTVYVRTTVLRDAQGALITEDAYMGKTIDVKGIIDYFEGNYQIKVFTTDQITVKN